MTRPFWLTPATKGFVLEFMETGEEVRARENMGSILRKDLFTVAVLAKVERVVPDGFGELGERTTDVDVKGFFANVDYAGHFLQFSLSMNPVANRIKTICAALAPSFM
jgi:hypothetical protein